MRPRSLLSSLEKRSRCFFQKNLRFLDRYAKVPGRIFDATINDQYVLLAQFSMGILKEGIFEFENFRTYSGPLTYLGLRGVSRVYLLDAEVRFPSA